SSSMLQSNFSSNLSLLKMMPSMMQLSGYIRKQIKIRRQNPKDDLLTALIDAEEAGDSLSEGETVAMVVLLLIAGHETTVNLIASGMATLLQYPEQLEQLRANPEQMPSAIEELLRYTVPVETATERYAREDITLHDVTIPKGSLTLAALASANRDETIFQNPDTLDITRSPNRHLSFGHGIHYCLGAPLARMEGAIAIQTLLDNAPDIQLAIPAGQLEWRQGMVLRGLKKLPVLL
ncbi:MAG: cytochrome P450, partial [Chloroflexota bacterium]